LTLTMSSTFPRVLTSLVRITFIYFPPFEFKVSSSRFKVPTIQ
jgi:hypothetical protein